MPLAIGNTRINFDPARNFPQRLQKSDGKIFPMPAVLQKQSEQKPKNEVLHLNKGRALQLLTLYAQGISSDQP